jgi:hypothetical protein
LEEPTVDYQCSIAMAILIALSTAFGCPAQERSVAGPESKDLLKGTAGYILYTPRTNLIEAVSLPDLKTIVVRLADNPQPEWSRS